MKVRILVDSTVNIKESLKEKLTVVPLTVHFGEEEYLDGVNIDHETFYRKLMESRALPTTSQATPAAFAEAFREISDAGECAVVITVASALSGTYQSAMIAAEEYPGIYVVDSETASIGAGILVQRALQMAEEGFCAEEIVQVLEQEKKQIRIVALVDTLEYLKRGGRISKTVAFAGNLLGIKPILSVAGGQICMLGKARGSRQGNQQLVREMEKAGGIDSDKPVLLGYSGLCDENVRDFLEGSKGFWNSEPEIAVLGSVIGTHVGPGAVAVAFFQKENDDSTVQREKNEQ